MLGIVLWLAVTWSLTTAVANNAHAVIKIELNPLAKRVVTLKCHKKQYIYTVIQSDENGKKCGDKISVDVCWGRCDSYEIPDWRFPFKISHHPVCIHSGRTEMFAVLRYCEDGVKAGTNYYEYVTATECKCQTCTTTDTNCNSFNS
ncbi:thyrostimulin beta-5 subunit-like [Diabrotica virgifera virgifera]|nr:thyrostimulin beta-5 subunit-like [Diabrotica virgifera virgifera]XP_050505061.1 thyrostimulin beta-5 subunit-like [Diabrotica virgifera virgifera]